MGATPRSRGSQDLLPRVTSGGMTTAVVCFGATKRQVVEDASPPLSIISTTTLKLSSSIFILKSKSRLRAVKGRRPSSGFEPRSLWLQACQKHRSWVAFRAGTRSGTAVELVSLQKANLHSRPWSATGRAKARCTLRSRTLRHWSRERTSGDQAGLQGATRRKARSPGLEKRGRLTGENPTLGAVRGCLARGRQDRCQKTLHPLLSFSAQP